MPIDMHLSKRIALINPNTNAQTTAAMAEIVRAAAPGWAVTEMTAAFGAPIITTAEFLAEAGEAVLAIVANLSEADYDGVIIAAFGDPALAETRERLSIPVVGIAEAGMRAGAAHGRFAIVTTTPGLQTSMQGLAERYGVADRLVSIRLTDGSAEETMRDPAELLRRLHAACEAALLDKVNALVIGGGPLAVAARALATMLPVPIIEPLPEAVAALRARLS